MASDDGDTTPNRLRHPAKLWPNSWLFHDRSDQPEMLQVIDLLQKEAKLEEVPAGTLEPQAPNPS